MEREDKREIPPGYRRMTKEEFIERMQRDALRRRGELPGEDERKEDAERDERERIRKQEAELNAYRGKAITKYVHNLYRKDRKARVRGSL